nr:hypothetical protein [uncultured Niameybacter sp.]
MSKKNNLINLFVFLSSILSFGIIISNFNNIAKGYTLVSIFPVTFLVMYFLTIANISNSRNAIPVTTYMFLILQWLRYVLTPLMISLSGEKCGTHFINPETMSLNLACTLMIIDAIITFLVMFYLARKKKISPCKDRVLLQGNKYIYILYVLFAAILYLIVGRGTGMLNFLFISVESGERLGDITSTSLVIVRQIVLIAVFLVFVWSVASCSKQYKKTGKKKYFYLSVLLALLNVSIIVGERRSAQVYTGFCSVWVLCYAYPEFKRKIILAVGGLATIMLTMMSIYKFSGAFIYGSYSEALKNSNFDVAWLSATLQSYFAGPQDFAAVIDFGKSSNVGILNLIYDFMRSTIPISFFVKGGNVTSQMFNYYLYNGTQNTGHIISAAAYGYLYCGIIFSSVFSVVNLCISAYFERKMQRTDSYEMMYVWAYVLMRFGLNLTANTPVLISAATMMLMTGGLLFKTANIMKIRIVKR